MTKLLLVGCGKMGQALLSGWLANGLAGRHVVVVEPAGLPETFTSQGVVVVDDAATIPKRFSPDLVLLAVKPQVLPSVLPAYAPFTDALFLSIAAGKTLPWLMQILGAGRALVRAMPNTPASVGRGITVCCANSHVDATGRALCTKLLSAVGEVEWIDDEAQMDAVTAVSGSGPAYVFLLAEALEAAGTRAGLPPELARRLARATVAGSGELLRQSELTASTLRDNVTSPGGTTAAAIEVLTHNGEGLPALMRNAVAAAIRRSRELAAG